MIVSKRNHPKMLSFPPVTFWFSCRFCHGKSPFPSAKSTKEWNSAMENHIFFFKSPIRSVVKACAAVSPMAPNQRACYDLSPFGTPTSHACCSHCSGIPWDDTPRLLENDIQWIIPFKKRVVPLWFIIPPARVIRGIYIYNEILCTGYLDDI